MMEAEDRELLVQVAGANKAIGDNLGKVLGASASDPVNVARVLRGIADNLDAMVNGLLKRADELDPIPTFPSENRPCLPGTQ